MSLWIKVRNSTQFFATALFANIAFKTVGIAAQPIAGQVAFASGFAFYELLSVTQLPLAMAEVPQVL
jgi:hypothetical protein